jgi:MFS family permease
MASTIGWRWAFLLLLPLVPLAAWLVFPGLARLPRPEKSRTALDLRKPFALAVGSAAVLLGLTSLSPWSVPLVMLGGLLAGVALRGLLAGSARGRAGFGAALLAGFLLSLAFFAVDGFVPLLLTRIRGRTVAEASVVVTLATVGWSAGSLWQSQVVARRSKPALIVGGAVAIAVGAVGVAAGLLRTPLALPYAAWAVAGLGMGVAYPTIYLAMMERATPGSEGAAVALLLLLDSLGVSAGTGLGGSAVAIVETMDVSLRVGLAVAFGLALSAALALMPLATRLRD